MARGMGMGRGSRKRLGSTQSSDPWDQWNPTDPWQKAKGQAGSGKGSNSERGSPEPSEVERPDDDRLLPSEVRGWLLLSDSGLNHSERSTVIASTPGGLKFPSILGALRQQFPPRDLAAQDASRRRMQPKGRCKGRFANHLDSINESASIEKMIGSMTTMPTATRTPTGLQKASTGRTSLGKPRIGQSLRAGRSLAGGPKRLQKTSHSQAHPTASWNS